MSRPTGSPPCIVCGVTAREGLLCYACAKRRHRDRRRWETAAAERKRDRDRKRQLVEVECVRNGQLGLIEGGP